MKTIYQAIVLPLIFSTFCFAEQKEFTQTVKYIMGENESRQELRELATLEAKRRILEQVGIYIESTTELKQTITENNAKLLDESEFNREIIAITAGVTNTTIDKEEWKDENGVFVLYLTCRISVDTEDVNSTIQALVRDRKKLADVKIHQEENARLQHEIEELRNQLELAKTTQIKGIKLKRQVLSSEYSAVEWYSKGLKIDDLDKKIEYYSYSIVQSPKWSYPYNNRGLTYYYKGEYNLALTDCNRAIQIDPNYSEAYNNRGISYNALGQNDRALMDYNKAIQINPNDATAYCNRGVIYNDKSQYHLALKDYNKAVQIDPNFATAYNNRGNTYHAKGEDHLALMDYNRAIQINPNHDTAYNNRGEANRTLGEYDRALKDYNKAIQIDPSLAGAYSNRGLTYYIIGKYNKALKDYNRAIQIEPNDAGTYNNRGIIYQYKGYYDRAIADFNRAIQADPKYAIAYHHRGLVYFV